ncbi:MAG: FHA domain-containing protein [Nocardioides sp.]|nr:FHA domain-containing protein [Nocardioides sp.]
MNAHTPRLLSVEADLDFEVSVAGDVVRGKLSGRDGHLRLDVSDPVSFAGRDDIDSVGWVADFLAHNGLDLTVRSGGNLLLELGAVRSNWLSRRLTRSRNMRIPSVQGLLAGLRGRVRGRSGAMLPTRRLVPPATLLPLAPTLLRALRAPVATTHDPARGGRPRLVLAPGSEPSLDGRRSFRLREGVTTIGTGAECDIRLRGLEERHAEVRHDEDDEFVLFASEQGEVQVHGQSVTRKALRTGARIGLGRHTLSFARDEFADHGRPYGGRQGGEAGYQRTQPGRHSTGSPS